MRREIQTTLETAIKAGWTGDVPLAFENCARTEDKGAWARFFIVFGEESASAIGQDFTRLLGYFGVQIFIPENKGMKAANIATDTLAALFKCARYPLTGEGSELQIEAGPDGPSYKGTKDGMAQYHATMVFRAEKAHAPA